MNQLIWKLHYRQVYWALGALAVLTALLVVTGIKMADDYHSFQATCAAAQSCGDASNILFRGDGFVMDVVDSTLVVCALFGMFWGAPLVAKEYEDGTQNLAWTQGTTRRKWFGVNVAWVFTAAVVWAGALTVLVTWWRAPESTRSTAASRPSTSRASCPSPTRSSPWLLASLPGRRCGVWSRPSPRR